MKKYPTLTFRLDAQLLKTIQREAKKQKTTVGQLVRDSINNYLGK